MSRAASARRVVTVSELTRSLQDTLDRSHGEVWVAGEASNVTRAASGHVYFVLKDENARLATVVFRSALGRLGFVPEDGLQLVVGGRIGLYPARGALQLYAEHVEPLGAGALAVAFEQLKTRLEADGLFALERKRPLPRYPETIGIVTSLHGAVVRDMRRVLRERWPAARLVIRPAPVQGAEAAPAVADAIRDVGRHPDVQVLIVGRGGGSLEDLWAFNTEAVARALAASPVPTISAVGHESDVTIADLVADLRASTPTAAATAVAPDRRELLALVRDRGRRSAAGLERRVGAARLRLVGLERGLADPARRVQELSVRLDDLAARARAGLVRRATWEGRAVGTLGARLVRALRQQTLPEASRRLTVLAERVQREATGALARRRTDVARLAGKLGVLSPLASLARGYAIVRDPTSHAIVRDARRLSREQVLEVLLGRGRARVRVIDREG